VQTARGRDRVSTPAVSFGNMVSGLDCVFAMSGSNPENMRG